MTDLDNKLREILEDGALGMYMKDENGDFVPINWKSSPDSIFEPYISQIRQAFQDEGYLTPEQKEQTQKLVNQMAQTAQDMAKLPVTVREVGTMTGQEWYDRFEPLLEEIDLNSKTRYREIKEAAKKASGIKQ